MDKIDLMKQIQKQIYIIFISIIYINERRWQYVNNDGFLYILNIRSNQVIIILQF
jgi:hypothetical protein